MPFDAKSVEGKTSDELISVIKELTEKIEKPAEVVAPAAVVAPVVAEPKLSEAPVVVPAAEVKDDKKFAELEEKNKNLAETVKTLTEKNRKIEIEKKLSEYAEAGMAPVVLEKAKEILFSENAETRTFKFSEKEGEKVIEKDHTFAEAVYAILNTIPTIQLGESVIPAVDGSADLAGQDNSELAIVKKYAEENKISFNAAYTKCLSEGKIKKGFDTGVEL
jgi:hypothetical protein